MRDTRGFTLIETVVALSLVATVGLSVSTALLAGRAIAVQHRDEAIGRVAARARLVTLQALTFDTIVGADGAALAVTDTSTDVAGDPPGPGGTGLRASPVDALWRDRAGYVDYLDAMGRPVPRDAVPSAAVAYVRRWAIDRRGDDDVGEVALIAVLVAPLSAAMRAAAGDPAGLVAQPGVVVLRGARVRQAS